MSDREQDDRAEQDKAERDRAKWESAEGVDFRRRLARNMPTFLSHQRWCEEHGSDDW